TWHIILGMGHDPKMGNNIAVTVSAPGFHHRERNTELPALKQKEPEKIRVTLNDDDAPSVAAADNNATEKPQIVDPLAPSLVEGTPANSSPASSRPPVSQPAPPVTRQDELPINPTVQNRSTAEPAPRKVEEPEPEQDRNVELELVIKNK